MPRAVVFQQGALSGTMLVETVAGSLSLLAGQQENVTGAFQACFLQTLGPFLRSTFMGHPKSSGSSEEEQLKMQIACLG